MSTADFAEPIRFKPLFFERVWGGRRLADLYHKSPPAGKNIGESWEIVDRAEAQSVVAAGPLAGRSLHDLWVNFRRECFGNVPDAPRFPLLVKLLDCRETLSLQVHPPAGIAEDLGGEPKTEAWFIAAASDAAELHLGVRDETTPEDFRSALESGTAAELVHQVQVKTGDTFFIPSGRLHAIGSGNLIVEIQQNSDTTYRVFDWNRTDVAGKPRELHVEQALACIDFADNSPSAVATANEVLVTCEFFDLQRWKLSSRRVLTEPGRCAVVFCLAGEVRSGNGTFRAGDFFLLPASANNRAIENIGPSAELLRVTIPLL